MIAAQERQPSRAGCRTSNKTATAPLKAKARELSLAEPNAAPRSLTGFPSRRRVRNSSIARVVGLLIAAQRLAYRASRRALSRCRGVACRQRGGRGQGARKRGGGGTAGRGASGRSELRRGAGMLG